jgi:hypothetical protein
MQLVVNVQLTPSFGGLSAQAMYIGELPSTQRASTAVVEPPRPTITSCMQRRAAQCFRTCDIQVHNSPLLQVPPVLVLVLRLMLVLPSAADTEGSFMTDRLIDMATAAAQRVQQQQQQQPAAAGAIAEQQVSIQGSTHCK